MHERDILAGKAQPIGLFMWDKSIKKFVPLPLTRVGDDEYFVPTINIAHQQIHEGETFSVSYADDALADDVTIEFVFSVADEMGQFTFGAAYRWDAALSAMVGFQLSEQLMLGLAYDRETTDLGGTQFNDGSFEVFLRFELVKSFRRLVSPRFF